MLVARLVFVHIVLIWFLDRFSIFWFSRLVRSIYTFILKTKFDFFKACSLKKHFLKYRRWKCKWRWLATERLSWYVQLQSVDWMLILPETASCKGIGDISCNSCDLSGIDDERGWMGAGDWVNDMILDSQLCRCYFVARIVPITSEHPLFHINLDHGRCSLHEHCICKARSMRTDHKVSKIMHGDHIHDSLLMAVIFKDGE